MRARVNPTAFYGSEMVSWQLAGLTLSESFYPANLKMPVHEHEPAYFGIVLKGGYSETLGRKTRDCKQLATVFHPQGESHSVAFGDTQTHVFRIELSGKWREHVQSYATIPTEPAEFHGGLLASLALRLYNEYRTRDQWSQLSIEGISLEILAELARASARRNSDREMPRWLESVKESLASKLDRAPSLKEMAEEVGVHPAHLARAWRKHFHCAMGDSIRQLRVEMACEEIASSDAPLSEIALRAGFYDQSHFSNTFKRFAGMTPAAYRAICRAG